jgi:hypothetical protein
MEEDIDIFVFQPKMMLLAFILEQISAILYAN